MTALSEVASLDIGINNRVSEGAAAAARDLEKVEAAADKAAAALKDAEVGTRLVGDTFERTAAKSDVLAAADLRRVQITARAEREIAALTAAAAREGRTQDELAAAISAVTLRRDADIAKAQRQAEVQRAQQLALVGGASAQTQAMAAGVTAVDRYAASNDNATKGTGRLGQAIGQAGFQLQDFVVQIGSGQNALVALGQQGSQLLGVFGTGGAIAGAALAMAAMTANFLLGKSAAEELKDAIEGIERSSQGALQEADRMETALRRQNSQFLSGAAAGDRYRQGLQGMGEELVRLARYYERLTEAQRQAEGVSLDLQRRALTAGSGQLQRDILRPIQGRIVTAEGGAAVDFSGMGGGISQGSTSIENVPQELRALTQDAIRWRDAGRITAEGVQSLINSVATAKAGSTEYRAELEAYERQLIGLLPRIREYEDAMRRVGVAETALNPANAAQVALEGMRGATSEIGGSYQARQRIREQRRLIQDGLASGLATPEDRLAGRSSLQQLAQQEHGMTPATQQQLRALQEQVTISRAAEGAARDLAQAEMDLDRAARGAGLGQASAAEKAEARRLVQERLNETLATNMVTLNRQITGEQAIADAYGRSAQEGRLMEAAVRAQAEALKYGAEGSAEYERALVTLTTRYDEMAGVQAQRQLSQRNLQSQNELEYLQREAQLIGASADARERELAALRARQSAGAAAGSDAAKEAERLAVQLVDTRRTTDQLRNSWNDLASFGENAFSKIGDAITQGFAQGKIEAIRFKDIAKAAMSEVVQAVMRLAVINPILNSVFGGTRGTLGGIMQVGGMGGIGGLGSLGLEGGGATIVGSDGSIIGQLGNMSSGQTVMRGLGGFNPGNYMSGSMPINTGWSGLDNVLNTSILNNGITGGMAGGLKGGMDAGLGGAKSAMGSGGLTYGGAAMGALGVAGGLYGAYSGFQRGGVGGYTQAAGGAATAGLSAAAMAGMAIPVYGWIAAAVLSIVGALLPGQKPSGKGQEFRYDLGSGDVERNGLTGNRYSAENASQAELATRGIVDLANKLGERLGGLRNDGQVAVGVTSSRGDGPGTLYLEVNNKKAQFANDEEGAKQLADRASQLLLEQLRERATGDYRGILNASGNSVEKLDENLTWYETTYKSLTGAADATSAFGQQVKALTDQWQASIDKANELGLATARLNERRDEELAKLYAQRDLQVRGFDVGLDIRMTQATAGDSTDALRTAALLQFDWQAQQQLAAARDTLESLGLASDEVTRRLARNEEVLAAERLAVQREYSGQSVALQQQAAQQAASVITSLADYARGLAYSDKSALSVQDQYGLALSQYNAVSGAAMAGDANSLSKLRDYSETVLGAGRAMYGSGAEYASLFGRVADTLNAVAQIGPDTLTASYFAQIQQAQTQTLATELQLLRSQVEALTTIVRQQGLAPPRAAA